MPLYRCTTPGSVLSDDARAEIANAITEIHCDVTGAPKTFVHVFFLEENPNAPYAVMGSIRAGRTDAQKTALHRRMTDAVAAAAAVPVDSVTVSTMDVPASWVMEGGTLLPEPGEEDAWLAEHQAKH